MWKWVSDLWRIKENILEEIKRIQIFSFVKKFFLAHIIHASNEIIKKIEKI